MFFKKIIYGFYMVWLRLQGFKFEYIKKTKGEAASLEYIKKIGYNWSKFTMNIIGIDLDVTGLENIPKETCVFIGNHSSILDIPILLYITDRNLGFIAKKEMLKTPIIGYWLRNSKCVPIDRENPRTAMVSINEAIKNIKEGNSMVIFPEGTRNKEGKVGQFKKGALKLATKSKAPIVPVSIDRASRAFEDNREFRPTKIKVVFGKTIDTKNLSKEDEGTLAEEIRNIIITNLEEA
ncbi:MULTISPECIES: lysophospholipid acyltransferase family protein [unclassified Clostridium]|uniref:lysophospholipid acyltransferase family protein n=1 Tax=unclassified Clostridium TaxID=2614128 RepID=UPI0002978F30|nr:MULTISPECIES: lysophospholipid acyltransferase family protein [unclassified Clostridium]EKQ58267.1 MAG: 1-acyl-sn-glycerol-3-phosphate acyltransferase [Clostridium sp. Maddingley MBC34-26]